MLKKEDIEHLALLARISVSDEEKEEIAAKVDSILGYVSTVSAVVTEEVGSVAGELRNVLREDVEPYSGGEWSEAILQNAPAQEDGFVKVGQIF